MAGETELERLVIRLVGDASSYREALEESIDLTESFQAKSEQLTKAEENRQRQLSETYGDRNAVMKEGATVVAEMNPVLEVHTEQIGKIVKVLDKWVTLQGESTQSSRENEEAIRSAEGAAGGLSRQTDKLVGSTETASVRINDAGTVMGAFAVKTEMGAARSLGNLGRTASQAGLAVQMINPALGQTITTIGLLTASIGQASATLYRSKTAFTGLISLALNPFTLVAIPLAVAGLVLWKKHTDAVKKAQEELELATRRVAQSAEEYGKYLQIFGKTPGIPPKEGDIQKTEAAAEARYKAENAAYQVAQKELAEMQKEEANRRRKWNIDNPPQSLSAGWLSIPIAVLTPGRMEDYRTKQMQKAGEDNEKAIAKLAEKSNEALAKSERAKKDWESTKAPAVLEKTDAAMDKFLSQQEKRRVLGKDATEIEKTLYDLMENGVSGPMLRHARATMEQNDLNDKRIDQEKALTDEINRQNVALEEAAVTEYNKQLDEADRLTKHLMTSQEKFVDEKKRLDKLLEAKGEEWRPTYDRAIAAARKEASGLKEEISGARAEMAGLSSLAYGSAAHLAMLGVNPLGGPRGPGPISTGKDRGPITDAERAAYRRRISTFAYQGPTTSMEGPLVNAGGGPFSIQGPTTSVTDESGGTRDLLQRLVTIAEKYWKNGTSIVLEPAGLK